MICVTGFIYFYMSHPFVQANIILVWMNLMPYELCADWIIWLSTILPYIIGIMRYPHTYPQLLQQILSNNCLPIFLLQNDFLSFLIEW